uniref:Uncharacterized protein n=1 Tax=Oryza meridionalis TaxID=40149 RepID=A0A0E0ESW0_9ORYZ
MELCRTGQARLAGDGIGVLCANIAAGVTTLGALDAATVALLEALDQLDAATAMRHFRFLERLGADGVVVLRGGDVADSRSCGFVDGVEGTRRQGRKECVLGNFGSEMGRILDLRGEGKNEVSC